jgi:hypothetical protein
MKIYDHTQSGTLIVRAMLVSGHDAVAIELRSGKKFALGTDEPEVLCAIIQQNLR